jgi:hypothetical protein
MTTTTPRDEDEPTIDPLVEVLAYLITAARTQLDEAAEYAPMRMLTAAQRLGDALRPDAPEALHPVIAALDAVPPTATPRGDRAAYTKLVDDLCRRLADALVALTHARRPPGAGEEGAP